MIGDKIKAQRLAMGLTQEELAARMGYKSKSTINKIELNINDIPLSKVEEFAKVLHVSTAYLMDWLPPNIITPAARPVPVLGTICAGNGTVAEENFVGNFFIDNTVQADYALRVNGDSMVEAEIYNGDMAFLRKDFEFRAGWIYAVVHGVDREASLKKVFRQEDKLILQPCNSDYSPIIADVQDCYIVGELVGVYHSYSGTIVCK